MVFLFPFPHRLENARCRTVLGWYRICLSPHLQLQGHQINQFSLQLGQACQKRPKSKITSRFFWNIPKNKFL